LAKRSKQIKKLGRLRNNPQRSTEVMPQQSIYGSIVPFTTINGKKHVTPKPNALAVRNFAKNNAIVRRCINVIKDAIAKKKLEIYDVDGNDNVVLKEIFTNLFAHPNSEDTARTFRVAITEDLVSGDCGCIELAKSGNPSRPMALFSVDGFSMEFVLGNDVIKFAQRQSNGYSSFPSQSRYYAGDEILYLKKQVFTNTPYGLSPIESAWDYIRALTNAFSYSTEIASNALPKYMANIQGMSPELLNAYRAYFMQDCMGTPNLPLVSAEGIESVQIAPISEEATFKTYQEFIIGIIALEFNIPPEKVAIAKSNDRSTIDEINENMLQECIIPYCDVIEEAFNTIIDKTGYSDKVAARFIHEETLAQRKMKQDMATDAYQKDLTTANEARGILGLPPVADEYGDDRITLMKAKINEKYGIQGFGDSKANNIGTDSSTNKE